MTFIISTFQIGKTYHICGRLRFVHIERGWFVVDKSGRSFTGPFVKCPVCKERMPAVGPASMPVRGGADA